MAKKHILSKKQVNNLVNYLTENSSSKKGKQFQDAIFEKLKDEDFFYKLFKKKFDKKENIVDIDSRTKMSKGDRKNKTIEFTDINGKFKYMNASAALKGDIIIEIDGKDEVFDVKNYSEINNSFKFPIDPQLNDNNFIKGSDSNIKYPIFFLLKNCISSIYEFLFPKNNIYATKELENKLKIVNKKIININNHISDIKKENKNIAKENKNIEKEISKQNDNSKQKYIDILNLNNKKLEKNEKELNNAEKMIALTTENRYEIIAKISEIIKNHNNIELNKREEVCEISNDEFLSIFRLVELGFAWKLFNIKPNRNFLSLNGNKLEYKYVNFNEIKNNVKIELYLNDSAYLYIYFTQNNKVLFIISRRADGGGNCSFINKDYVHLVNEVNLNDYELKTP